MVDRSSFTSAPTEVPIGHQSGTRRIEGGYFGAVRRVLIDLGSRTPDEDLARSGSFLENCRDASIPAMTCATVIYGAEHHRHNVESTTLKEPEVDLSAMPAAGEPVEVLHEPTEVEIVVPVTEGCIPWAKVNRDEALHERGMKLAEKYGSIKTAMDVYAIVGAELAKEQQEVFLVLPVNVRGELMAPPFEVARGQVDQVVVVPDDNIWPVIAATRCKGFICVHNHPSGVADPSKADLQLDNAIRKSTGKKYIDHVIIGTGVCYSIRLKRRYKVKGA